MNSLIVVCACTIALSSFVHCKPPTSLQIEKQTIIELPSEIINNDAMDDMLRDFLISQQKSLSESNKSTNETASNSVDKEIATPQAIDLDITDNVKAREDAMELDNHDLDEKARPAILEPEHMILITPMIKQLLNNNPVQAITQKPNDNKPINNIQDELKRLDMDNTVINIHYLVRNKLSQLHNGNTNKNTIKDYKPNTGNRWKIPMIQYTPFITEDEILEVPTDFMSIVDIDPEDNICCGNDNMKIMEQYVFDRNGRDMKNDQASDSNPFMKYEKKQPTGKRLNDKFASDIEDLDDSDAEIVIENLALNGKAQNYRSGPDENPFPAGDREYNLPEFRINNPFERTTTALPVLNNDGIYINRLKIRKGGVAIAGPNGVATAGSGGTAIVGPGGVAYTKPDGLAVAGPGARVISVPSSTNLREFFAKVGKLSRGRSNSHDLPIPEGARLVALGPVIYYNTQRDVYPEHRQSDDVIELPYYGGAKGQILQIKTSPDGSVISEIIKQKVDKDETNDYKPHLPIRVNSLLNPSAETDRSNFVQNLHSIKASAQKLVDLQQAVKHTGSISKEQQKVYAENLEILGSSAQKLVKDEGDSVKSIPAKLSDAKKKVIPSKKQNEYDDTEEQDDGTDGEDGDDSVQVNIPPDDASVAEAKPVGLAIAGIGGVASSKPVATAIVGPGGLAVAKPVATAIAGVPPSEITGLGIPYPGKKKNPSAMGTAERTEYLPGKFVIRE